MTAILHSVNAMSGVALCTTPTQMLKHEGTEECKEQECTNKGVVYTPPAPPRCDVCGIDFKNKWCLAAHFNTQTHKKALKGCQPLHCTTCDKTFKTSKIYKIHIATRKHKENLRMIKVGELVIGNDRLFNCPVCDKTFPNRKCLMQNSLKN